jgi:L-rhamnose isomerase/sugar isomerase
MRISKNQIEDFNKDILKEHGDQFDFLRNQLSQQGIDVDSIVDDIGRFQVAIPSWALGTGGTRFGRFPIGGQPSTLEGKIEDVGLLHALTQSAGAISLHIPWDTPANTNVIKQLAASHGIMFDAMNSNTFQDQPSQKHSYKFGSLSHVDPAVRTQAVQHNKEVIDIGKALGSKSLTVWLADGSSFPGQQNFSQALERTLDGLKEIYAYMPNDWHMFIEYKPFEPNFYSMVIPDWGTAHLLSKECGDRAYCLVDLGHHLQGTNIEQIVATLLWLGKLGGFHFNDSKYADDDLTVGSLKPYQLFLVFNELTSGTRNKSNNPLISWMIDASHNLKDPLEDLMQSLEAIKLAYAQSLIVDRDMLHEARQANHVTRAQDILQDAFRTDVRPLVREARFRAGGALDPIALYRAAGVRDKLISERGVGSKASGL